MNTNNKTKKKSLLKTIKKYLSQFIFTLFIFSGAWYLLEQKKDDNFKLSLEAERMKAQSQVLINEYSMRNQELQSKEIELQIRYKEQSRDKELSDLTLKYINEFSHINIHQTCGDDEEQNQKVRQARALLSLIEAKAKEYGRTELTNTFIENQRFGISWWSSNCKS